jgi:membrane-associated protein
VDLTDLNAGSPLSYAVAFALPALDVVLPVLPSETAIVTLGVATAGRWDARLALLVAVAAIGAFTGDNLAYLIGRHGAGWVRRGPMAGPSGARRLDWAVRHLDRYGTRLVIACRFVPGGRTAVTLACGLTGYPRRRFVPATAVAAVLWAAYAFLIGRIGGTAFADRPWIGLALALGLALAATGLIEAVRRMVGWRSGRRTGRTGEPTRRDRAARTDAAAGLP